MGWGTKIPKDNFLKIGFETKKYHFCVLFALTVTVAILRPKFEKVIKTTQNVPKTIDFSVGGAENAPHFRSRVKKHVSRFN